MAGGGKGGGGGGGFDTSAMERAAAESKALQKEIYEETREDVKPWYQTGSQGIGKLQGLLGLGDDVDSEGYGSLLEKFGMDKFEEDPGYAFREAQGQKALERAMAAQGVTLGGGGVGEINPQVAQAIQDYSQGLASQEYGNAYNRYNADQQNVYNRLMGASNVGQNATGIMANSGQNYATNTGNITMNLAQAQTQAAQAAAANKGGGSMFGTLVGGGIGAYFGGPQGAMAGANVGNSLFSG